MHKPRLIMPALRWASRLYERELARRNARYDAGVGVVRFDRPVLSVGNISAGGTGKTPMVRWLIEQLQKEHTPAIAMRGYGARKGERSDEHDEYHRAFPGVPVVARPDRTEGLIELFGTPKGEQIDCIVLDDGFQHRRIARQLDLVLLDATAGSLEDACLPLGLNREPPENLSRADAIVITHAERCDDAELEQLSQQIERYAGSPPIAVTDHAWQGYELDGSRADELPSQPTLVVCAIGNPQAFVQHAQRELGPSYVGRVILKDHDPYSARTLSKINAEAHRLGARQILTTNKDWSKLRRKPAGQIALPVVRPRLVHRFRVGEESLRALVLRTVSQPVSDGNTL